MPKKKVRKPKTREYLETLLDNVGLTDRELAQAIKNGIESENATERAKALEMAGQWKGFAEVDKKRAEDEIEHLPLANISKAELDRLANRCSYCKHKQFESIHGGKAEPPKEPVMGPAVVPVESDELPAIFPMLKNTDTELPPTTDIGKGETLNQNNPYLNPPIDCSELLKTDLYPIITEAVKNMVEDIHEQTTQEKAD